MLGFCSASRRGFVQSIERKKLRKIGLTFRKMYGRIIKSPEDRANEKSMERMEKATLKEAKDSVQEQVRERLPKYTEASRERGRLLKKVLKRS